MPIAPQLWVGFYATHFLPSRLGFGVTGVFSNLMYAGIITVSAYVHLSCCFWKTLFPCWYPSPMALKTFLPLLWGLWSLGRWHDTDLPFRVEHSKISHLLQALELKVSVWMSTIRKSFSHEFSNMHWPMSIERIHSVLQINYLLLSNWPMGPIYRSSSTISYWQYCCFFFQNLIERIYCWRYHIHES